MKSYKYVIIGNSAGGIGAVEAIRGIDKDGSMAVISDEAHHVYGRPLISYYLADEIDFDKIFYRPLDFYEENNIDAILGKKVVEIDFENRLLVLDDGDKIGFEKLLLATGGEPFVPQIKGLDEHEFHTFITLDSALRIGEKLDKGNVKTAVVLGGGLVGLKATEALIQRGVQVKVVELADRILSPVLDQQASGIIQSVLEKEGVEVLTGRTISEVVGENSQVEGVVLDNGDKIDCELLIIGIGVRPRVELAKDTPIEIDRGIVVDKHMKTSVDDVYSCGDCAEVYDFIADNFRLTPLWPTAYVGGRVAGFNMAGVEKEYVWGTGMNAVDFFGFPVISAGLLDPPDDDVGSPTARKNKEEEIEVLTKLDQDENIYRKFIIRDGRIVGMILLNEVDRAGVILGLMRGKVEITSFKDDLLRGDFGSIHIPRELRPVVEETSAVVA